MDCVWHSTDRNQALKYLFFFHLLFLSLSANADSAYQSLENFCKGSDPIKLDLERGVSLDKFWEAYNKNVPKTDWKESAVVFELSHPANVYVMIFPRVTLMNSILGRPTVYLTEGKRIVTHQEAATPAKTYDGYVGHDLQESLLTKFANNFAKAENSMDLPSKSATKWLCPEASFWNDFLTPKLGKGDDIILIAAAKNYKTNQTVSHEVHHALFYRDPKLRKLIGKFWDQEVTTKDQKGIQKALHKYEYNVYENHELLLNEFFAYLLESKPESDILSEFTSTYSQKLREYLANGGVEVPEI